MTDQTKSGDAQPEEFSIKHPLQHEWALWYDNPEHMKHSTITWNENLKLLYKFASVEDFWSLWNNIKPASSLAVNCNYHLFKHGVQPSWEDPVNRSGGKWVHVVNKQRGPKLDSMWQGLVLAMIGNSFDDDDDISGAVISIRSKGGDKISIWTKTASDEDKAIRIGKQFLAAMDVESASIGYQAHAEALTTNTSFRNQNKYKIN